MFTFASLYFSQVALLLPSFAENDFGKKGRLFLHMSYVTAVCRRVPVPMPPFVARTWVGVYASRAGPF